MTTKSYPATVSRTISPEGMGLMTVIGQHDRQLSDADINLIQDLQDFKRQRVLERQAPSGCLTLTPMVFSSYMENCFFIPKFDVLFRGEVLTIQGNQSDDTSTNKVVLPGGQRRWAHGSAGDDAVIYVVFLELWGKALNPVDGSGYYVSPDGSRYIYPAGCVDAAGGNLVAYEDDVLDPFSGAMTTLRAQMQWRIRTYALPLAYDFSSGARGLSPVNSLGVAVPGRGSIGLGDPASSFPFMALAKVTGEASLWRAGDGNPNNSLGTLDGYTYATPLALAFQRNAGVFYADVNPFGCAPASAAQAGSFSSGLSGRLDGKFYDIVYPEDVVDTRTSVSLTGYELDQLATQGLTDLFLGGSARKITRGEAPGAKPTALGSRQTYTISVANKAVLANVDTVGSMDSWSNGFSSDARTFRTTRVFTLADRAVVGKDSTGTPNTSAWGVGDSLLIPLGTQVVEGAGITEVFVQSLMSKGDGTKVPLALYGGQLQIGGLNTRQATIQIVSDLSKLAQSPGNNPLVVTIGVTYPSGRADTRKVPTSVAGGSLVDSMTGSTLPVYGVSEYEAYEQVAPRTTLAQQLQVYSPFYSPSVFGVRVVIQRANTGDLGPQITTGDQGTQISTFTLSRKNLDGSLQGLYVIGAQDGNGKSLPITRRILSGDSMLVSVSGQLDASLPTVFTILCHRAAVIALNPPVRGVTALEETVLTGNAHLSDLTPDPRITVASVRYLNSATQITFYAASAQIHGLSGDDTGAVLVWKQDPDSKAFTALPATMSIQTGIVVLTVPGNNLEDATWFVAVALRPALPADSTLTLMLNYLPYQGEGVSGRDYEVVYAPEHALVTTNGTGAPPIVGLQDVFPFNRQHPISTSLPSLVSWNDAQLKNQALTSEIDGNYIAKRFSNIEHTLSSRLHTNDFIAPLHGYMRKKIRMTTIGKQGFSRAYPHVGFAIAAPTPRSILGGNLQTTMAAVTLYVNNQDGNDGGDGLTATTAKKTIRGALAALPPVIRHPVSIVLVDTGHPFTVKDLQRVDFSQALLGDGETRSIRHYCLGQSEFVMQESARITIGRATTTGARIIIDATGFGGFGDGPTYAFLVSDSRVIFHGITFQGFTSAAVKAIDSEVEFLDCDLESNLLGCSAEQGSFVTFNRGSISLGAEGVGCIATASQVLVNATQLKANAGSPPAAFFVAERAASLTLQQHNVTTSSALESGITSSTIVALGRTGSTVVCDPSWVSNGQGQIQTNSTLVRSVAIDPFRGGIVKDASSSDVPNL